MTFLLTFLFLLFTSMLALGQAPPTEVLPTPPVPEKHPVKLSLLSSYYEQDGDRSAVNGGWGDQHLTSFTQEVGVYIPVRDSSALVVHGGVDHYTAASLRQIDKYRGATTTGASRTVVEGVGSRKSEDETRTYGSLAYALADKKHRYILTPSVGVSQEYDVFSVNGGLSWAKYLPKRDAQIVSSFTIIADRWMVINPGEFRPQTGLTTPTTPVDGNTGASTSSGSGSGSGSGGSGGYGSGSYYEPTAQLFTDANNRRLAAPSGETITKNGKTFPVDRRYSLSWSNLYAFPINQRMNAAVGLDLVMQRGLLSTPFHRVYFNDGVGVDSLKEVRLENLPRQRYKIALSGRYNYFFAQTVALRTQARFYADSWGITAFTATLEVPVKLTKWLTATPFYRFHGQRGTAYFAGYGRHSSSPQALPDYYYTSDIDLATTTANKFGAALRIVPFTRIGIGNSLLMKSISIRYARYDRSDGLTADMLSLGLDFEL